jgi:hypothetical protein
VSSFPQTTQWRLLILKVFSFISGKENTVLQILKTAATRLSPTTAST